ncbi:MAG TPA: IPT/TIG domain-containing protein, partial [Thermoanaerobaculia bacterium]
MKASVRALLVLAVLAAPLVAADETIRVDVPQPATSTDPVRVTISGIWPDGCVPQFDTLEKKQGEITLRFAVPATGGCVAVLTAWSASITLPPLPAGTWDLRAIVRMAQGEKVLATFTLTIDAADPPFEMIPASGRKEGGLPIRIRAGGIGACEPCPRVAFGGVDAASVRVIDSSHLEVVPPPHDPGRVDVTVLGSGLGASVTVPRAFRYYDYTEGPPPDAFELILVPLMFEGDGAYGSRWTTALTVHNAGDAPVDPWMAFVRCGPGARCWPQLPAGATLHLTPATTSNWIHGYVYPAPREQADDLRFSLHVRDLSRAGESFGTEIPVVREREIGRAPIRLLDVPVGDGRYRVMLR